jgi:hypothetical protein
MFRTRKAIALTALLMLGGLIVTANPRGPGGTYERAVVAMWVLLAPLAITILGLARNRPWGRWMAVAAGIAVLPWATALTCKVMFDGYEGRAKNVDWSGRRMSLVRWTIICNVVSALGLYLFVGAYDHSIKWHLTVMAALLLGLIVGVLFLAHQRTIGLLLVALCCFCFVPVGVDFVWTETTDAGEVILFAAIFAPGILTGWASLFVFAKPLWAVLRDS